MYNHKQTFLSLVSVFTLLLTASTPTFCQSNQGSRSNLPRQHRTAAPPCEDDVLLLMPATDSDEDDIKDSLKNIKGEIIEVIGTGPMTVYKVRVAKGTLKEAETKISKDKTFQTMQRNWKAAPQTDRRIQIAARTRRPGSFTPNDPYFPQQWHLTHIGAAQAWNMSFGSNAITIGIMDTGVNYWINELKGKCAVGYDAFNDKDGQSDIYLDPGWYVGHGTQSATTMAAITDNAINGAGIAPLAKIYPIRICGDSHGYGSDDAIIKGLIRCHDLRIKVAAVNYAWDYPWSFAGTKAHPALDKYFKWFHDQCGGIVVNSAGNHGVYDQSTRLPYLIVVSATDQNDDMIDFTGWWKSNHGNPIWFGAPGDQVWCSGTECEPWSYGGTSSACPITAAVVALVWGAQPALKNTQVERILMDTATKGKDGAYWNPSTGFGIPNAAAAIKKILGR
jgi:subtilisin family serine protease